jgi:RNA polymerase sigma factor (sigma-70 family)
MPNETQLLPFDEQDMLQRWREYADGEALSRVFRAYAPAMWGLAYRLCGNAADADNCLQQACTQAMRFSRRGTVTSVRPWLLAIVVNASRDLLRSSRVRSHHERGAARPHESADPREDPLCEAVRQAVAQLPRSCAQPLVLAYVEGLSSEALDHGITDRERCGGAQGPGAGYPAGLLPGPGQRPPAQPWALRSRPGRAGAATRCDPGAPDLEPL